ncbi:rCG48141, partial [Rattus norvegicus]
MSFHWERLPCRKLKFRGTRQQWIGISATNHLCQLGCKSLLRWSQA